MLKGLKQAMFSSYENLRFSTPKTLALSRFAPAGCYRVTVVLLGKILIYGSLVSRINIDTIYPILH